MSVIDSVQAAMTCVFPTLVAIAIVVMLLVLIGVVMLRLTLFEIHPFLAKNAPIVTDVLVVEGWLPDYAIEAAMAEFKLSEYKVLITVGAPMPRGAYLSEYNTFAELAAATLVALGFDPAQLQVVPTTSVLEGRTHNAAMALKQHFIDSGELPIASMNVFTLGPHGRRTQRVFSQVFPAPTQVGIISTEILAYDQSSWWRSSEGVRTIIGEAMAYLFQRWWR
jgi:hypothetical protein